MSLGYILRLLALRERVVIVDSLNYCLYEGVVEDVPRDLWDLAVAHISPVHHDVYDHDYLWIEVL